MQRHLMFHMWPTARNEMWKWHIEQLKRHDHLFTGKRVVGIAVDEWTVALSEVERCFDGFRVDEFIVVKNDQTGEGSTLVKMIDLIPSDGGATFYCHTKGARYRRTGLGTTKRWSELMYSVCLSRYGDMIADRIETASAVGPFRRTGVIAAPWHFSGNFFWFHKSAVQDKNYRQLNGSYGCVECWIGNLIPYEESACPFGDDPGDLYSVQSIRHWSASLARQENPAPMQKVDIVVTSHNYGRFIRDALNSINGECVGRVIVVDDKSDKNDTTKQECENLHVDYIRTEHGHPHLARGDGFALCNSPLVCFLDGDDKMSKGYVDHASWMFSRNPKLGICYADFQMFGDVIGERIVPSSFAIGDIDEANFISSWSVWSSDAIRSTDSFGYVPLGWEDWWMAKRITDAGWEAQKNAIPMLYRKHRDQMTERYLRGEQTYLRGGNGSGHKPE